MRLPEGRAGAHGANPILAISAACRRRRVFGQPVIDLSVGQPDFETPAHVGAAAAAAVARGETRYPPLLGIGELRVAIRRHLAEQGLDFRPREVLVTAGATGALSCAFQALLEPGDRVLVPIPYYPAYQVQIGLAGGVPQPVPTRRENGFRLTAGELRQAAASGARVLVLNHPNNPTGAVYRRDELEELAATALELDLDVIADEVYSDFVFSDPPFTSFASLGPEIRNRTLLVRSLSKSYAMTGWRIGYAAGPAPVIAAMVDIQHAALVGPATPCQWAAVAALDGDQGDRTRMVSTFEARHAYVRERLAAMLGAPSAETRGAFFAFPDLSSRFADVDSFCRALLSRHGVAVVPGSAFGAPGCLRLSYAVEMGELEQGLDRLEAALEEEGQAHGTAA